MALESLLLPIFERLLYDKYSSNVPHHQRCHSSSSEMMRNVFDYVIFLVALFQLFDTDELFGERRYSKRKYFGEVDRLYELALINEPLNNAVTIH